jgi:hypothetical protein
MGYSNKPKYFPGDVTGEISMSIQDGDDQIATDQKKINDQVVASWDKSFWPSTGVKRLRHEQPTEQGQWRLLELPVNR